MSRAPKTTSKMNEEDFDTASQSVLGMPQNLPSDLEIKAMSSTDPFQIRKHMEDLQIYSPSGTLASQASPVRTTRLLPRTRAPSYKRSMTSPYSPPKSPGRSISISSRPITHHGLSEAHQAVSRWIDIFPSSGPDFTAQSKSILSLSEYTETQFAAQESPMDERNSSTTRMPNSVQQLESRLESLAEQMKCRQEEARAIADLAAQRLASQDQELAELRNENSSLRKALDVSDSTSRVLSVRLQSLEERLGMLNADARDSDEHHEATNGLARSVKDLRKNFDRFSGIYDPRGHRDETPSHNIGDSSSSTASPTTADLEHDLIVEEASPINIAADRISLDNIKLI